VSVPVITSFAGPFDVRLGSRLDSVPPCHSVYVRRRLMVVLVFVALCAAIGLSAHSVLADRGGVPASTPAIQPVNPPVGAVEATPPAVGVPSGHAYIVQPGDTLWGIADRLHGQIGMSDYVERLVTANGDASIEVGQVLALP
jgi:Tfp pilus assembly protein FimV